MSILQLSRRLPIGAEIQLNGQVHFRVWAPRRKTVEVILENLHSIHSTQDPVNQTFSLKPEEDGYFSGLIEQATEGSLYRFRLDQEEQLYPDPASRYQPHGIHGPSQVINPSKFQWTDQNWKGVPKQGRILYELHVGTFTQKGTWMSAKQELLELADLGVNIIEMMPVCEFAGEFGWGYDGVDLFAPYHHYGSPEDLRDFINHAHHLGIAVILDVVYNHFGPDGSYLKVFSEDYFTSSYITEWGDAINFDDKNSKPVREFFLTNASYWIDEFHFDGLRIDAVQNIYDRSTPHILVEIVQKIREKSLHESTYNIGENERQQTQLVIPVEEGGYGLDAVWNDDFHHTALVRLTGRNEAYYSDYLGTPQEFISTAKYGYLYQGQWYFWQKKYRGTQNFALDPNVFINFIQNHDQIANSAHGLRIHQLTDPGNYRTMTALLLLMPGTPMLFQGQEFASSSPFYYFVDHNPELASLIFKGRIDFFKQFASLATPEIETGIPVPNDRETFNKCKLNYQERHLHKHEYLLHRDLIKLRRNDSVFNDPQPQGIDGAVLSSDAFLLRFFGKNEETRLLIINFGIDLHLSPIPEPLLAAPIDTRWDMLWSSEHPRYGGGGILPLSTDEYWKMPGHTAIVLIPKKMEKS